MSTRQSLSVVKSVILDAQDHDASRLGSILNHESVESDTHIISSTKSGQAIWRCDRLHIPPIIGVFGGIRNPVRLNQIEPIKKRKETNTHGIDD